MRRYAVKMTVTCEVVAGSEEDAISWATLYLQDGYEGILEDVEVEEIEV